MPLEDGDYIDALDRNNPVGATDPKSEGDDHLRLVKKTVQNTFPALTGPVTLTQDQLNAAAVQGEIPDFTGGQVGITGSNPTLQLTESDAGADNSRWRLEAEAEQFTVGALNDAETVLEAALTIDRTGVTVDGVSVRPSFRVFDAAGAQYTELRHDGTVGEFEVSNDTRLDLVGGAAFRAWNNAATRYIEVSADDNQANIEMSAGSLLRISDAGTFKLTVDPAGAVFVHDGAELRVGNATDDDFVKIRHVGGHGVIGTEVAGDLQLDPVGNVAAIDANIVLDNARALYGRQTDSVARILAYMTNADIARFGNADNETHIFSNASGIREYVDSVEVARRTSRAAGSIFVRDRVGVEKKAGFRNPTFVEISGAGDTDSIQDHEGRVIRMADTADYVFQQLEQYTVIRGIKAGGSAAFVREGAGVTLFWFNGSGSIPSGDRQISTGSVWEAVYYNTTTVYLFGSGID